MSENVVMMAVAMPIYHFLLMVPAFARAHRIFNPSSEEITTPNGSALAKPLVVDVNPEPRRAIDLVANNPDHPDAPFIRRAQGAHDNGWEGFTVFLAAMASAYIAQLDSKIVNVAIIVALVARFFYNIAYLSTSNPTLSFLRSGCFLIHHAALVYLMIKAIVEI
eukprot:TRINITY_DN243_c0_g1_i1.p1 TRINITY_DN243_c0_g1~~TRINITY_DN243_c0_g1_i1.p1  ORF type:complete len:187 (+),score=23.19 TRINITY_DN243_c0_g1_i1:72-563(+)